MSELPAIPLCEALKRFEVAKLSDGLKRKSVESYRHHVRLFLRSLPPERAMVGMVTAGDIDAFMASERLRLAELRKRRALAKGEPLTERNGEASGYSMLMNHGVLNLFFSWMEDSDELGNPSSPFRNRRGKKRKPPKVGQHLPRRASYDDVLKILRLLPTCTWLNQRDRAIVQLMLDTGLRAGEVCALQVNDLDMNKRELIVRSGKGNKDRWVPFTEKTRREVTLYLLRRPPCPEGFSSILFLSAMNAWGGNVRGPLGVGGLGHLWRSLSKFAGVPKINPHSVRHLYGFKALNDGVRLEVVSKLMGHASPGFTLKIYAPLLRETARADYEANWK